MIRILVAIAVFLPFIALAQSDQLSAQIRADLMQDPRTAQMSSAELDALVAALAGEAEASGAAATYLDAKSAPTFVYDAPAISTVNPVLLILSSPIVIAVLSLLAALLGVLVFILHARRSRKALPVEA